MPGDTPGHVLFVSPGPSIAIPASGEGARLHHLSKGLADRGWRVTTLVPAEVAAPDDAAWVDKTYTYKQWSTPFLTDLNPWFVRAMARVLRAEAIDVAHLSKGVCATKLVSAVLAETPTVVYAAQNVEAEHAREFVNPDLPVHKRFLGPRLIPWVERATMSCADGITTVSDHDRDAIRDRYAIADDRITTVPTGTERIESTEFEARETIRERFCLGDASVAIFHGTYEHAPNREAVDCIRDTIAPALEDHGVTFLLIGRGMPDTANPNVVSLGFVDDLYSVLAAGDVAVVPVLHGGGTNTKLYDYISVGLPIVATTKAITGIDLVDGEHGEFFETVDDAFVEAVGALAGDSERNDVYRENLLSFAAMHSWEQSVSLLHSFYGELR